MTLSPSTRDRPAVVAGAPRCELGEGPCWDPRSNRLLWVDLLRGVVHSLEADGTCRSAEIGQPVSAIAVDGDGWVLAVETGVQRRDASFAITETIELLPRPTLVRMNDAALDSRGRFWVGSLSYDEQPGCGALIRVDPDGRWSTVVTGLGISNGIAWSPDERVMYHVDSTARVVWAREFDATTGEVGATRAWFRAGGRDGVPDGIAADVEGGVWVALWGGASVIRLDADARITAEIPVPAWQTSSVAFGDPDLRTLYVTSAALGLDDRTAQAYPNSGRLFRFRVDIPGLPVGRP